LIQTFYDANGNRVHFSTENQPFSSAPQHVLVILKSDEGWILTQHIKRGLEFPGGKQEKGESIEEAAVREVWEETGALIEQLYYIGQYQVEEKTNSFVKNIYFAKVAQLEVKRDYMETKGPVILNKLPVDFNDETYSFIMKDEVMKISLKEIEKKGLLEEKSSSN